MIHIWSERSSHVFTVSAYFNMYTLVFFIRYEIDETNPEATFVEAMFVDEIYTYEILSKPTLKKTKAAAATVPCEHNGHAVH